MKYTLSNTINSTLPQVAGKINDPEGVKEWTEHLQKITPVSGNYSNVGSKRDLHYLFRGKEMIIQETILENNLPKQIKFSYDSQMGRNIVELCFEELSPNQVKQTSNTTMELKGAMKLFGFLFKSMFKKQSRKYMEGFKSFSES